MRGAILTLAGMALAAPALATPLCQPHDDLAALLRDRYGEVRLSVALDGAGSMIETWADAADGSWSITATRPGQPTCVIGAGWAWEPVAPEPKGEPA